MKRSYQTSDGRVGSVEGSPEAIERFMANLQAPPVLNVAPGAEEALPLPVMNFGSGDQLTYPGSFPFPAEYAPPPAPTPHYFGAAAPMNAEEPLNLPVWNFERAERPQTAVTASGGGEVPLELPAMQF